MSFFKKKLVDKSYLQGGFLHSLFKLLHASWAMEKCQLLRNFLYKQVPLPA